MDMVKQYESLMYQWIINEHNNKGIGNYFKCNDINKILIYGAGIIGDLLYQVLKDSDVDVIGFIDIEKHDLLGELYGLPIYSVEHIDVELERIPIVVTVGHIFNSVEESIRGIYECADIINIEDIVYFYDTGE